MKIEKTEVYGFSASIRGLRNPKNSWAKSDSKFYDEDLLWEKRALVPTVLENEKQFDGEMWVPEKPWIGDKDLSLMQALIRAGSADHRKFLRMIFVWVDFTIPLNVWAEVDTYKIATVRNSCSTMHKLGSKVLTKEDFEREKISNLVLLELNTLGFQFRKTGDMEVFLDMSDQLPRNFLQKATMTLNYETLRNMYAGRKHHKLPQWNTSGDTGIFSICKWIQKLPYAAQLLIGE